MSIVINKVHHPLYAELAAIVGPAYASDEDFVRLAYSRDTSPAHGKVQGIVVRPASTEQVSEIVKLANLTRTPIIPSGGRASYYGVPPGLPGRGIVVDMTRMKKMLSIDEENTVVTAEAGITTAELTTRLWERGWDVHTAVQPWYTDTVGGLISGMAGGGMGMEMSSTGWNTHHICGLKVVLPDGNVIQTGTGPGTNVNQKVTFAREPGSPDITGMFIGDAGVFGIKVEATYRMYRLAKIRDGKACVFDTFDEAWRFCLELSTVEPLPYCIISLIPPTPTTIEMGGPDKWLVMCIVKANREEEVASKFDIIDEVMRKTGGQFDEDPGAREWVESAITGQRYREMGEFGSLGVWTILDLIPPRSQVPECLHAIRSLHEGRLEENNIAYRSNNGIAAIGSNQWMVSSIIFLDGCDHKALEVMRDLFYEGLEMGASRGWFPDALQGYASIATAKYWSPSYANFVRTLKRSLDPNNIMNPGLWDL